MPLSAPLVLEPRLVAKPWGGDRLRGFGRNVEAGAAVGESWEVADLPADATAVADPVTRVAHGPFAGATLGELIASHPAELLGEARPGPAGRFPLLVKLLDARETLSIQVHPPVALDAAAHKTETWVVLAVEEGASLLLGVKDGVTLGQLQAVAGTGAVVDLLRAVPVAVGDVVHVPAGSIHALGAGVLVAEVQTPSDVTYRLYDWADERPARLRPLHVEPAMEAVRASWEHNVAVGPAPTGDGVLVDTDAYRLDRITLNEGEVLPASAATGRPRVVLVVDGGLEWSVAADDGHGDEGVHAGLGRGGVCVLPAACATSLRSTSATSTVLVATPA